MQHPDIHMLRYKEQVDRALYWQGRRTLIVGCAFAIDATIWFSVAGFISRRFRPIYNLLSVQYAEMWCAVDLR